MSKVNGTYSVTTTQTMDNQVEKSDEVKQRKIDKIKSYFATFLNGLKSIISMSKSFIIYLWFSGFALCAFLKACGSLTWGAVDVLNASFAMVHGDEAETSRRMGIIFSCAGFGCLIGPLIANATITKGDEPHTYQVSFFVIIIIYYFLILVFHKFFILYAVY